LFHYFPPQVMKRTIVERLLFFLFNHGVFVCFPGFVSTYSSNVPHQSANVTFLIFKSVAQSGVFASTMRTHSAMLPHTLLLSSPVFLD
uniref:Uncharacterized protein n=1 Tax=Chelydra serpentina TaxID=8475 RepID=A0A8C3SAJ1_CHESE